MDRNATISDAKGNPTRFHPKERSHKDTFQMENYIEREFSSFHLHPTLDA